MRKILYQKFLTGYKLFTLAMLMKWVSDILKYQLELLKAKTYRIQNFTRFRN